MSVSSRDKLRGLRDLKALFDCLAVPIAHRPASSHRLQDYVQAAPLHTSGLHVSKSTILSAMVGPISCSARALSSRLYVILQ